MVDDKTRLASFKQVKSSRTNWETYWQTLHDYYYIESANSNRTYTPGEELDFTDLYDSISLNAANVLPAGIANYMTPFSGHWMQMRHRDKRINDKRVVANWYKNVEDEIFYILSKSNFYEQIVPFYKSSGVYGTANIYAEDDPEDIIRFHNLPVKQCYIQDDARGRVGEYYIEFDYTTIQAVDRFGLENVSSKVRDLFKKGDRSGKRHPYMLYIGPRHDRNPNKEDALSMPIAAIWYDMTDKVKVGESGYTRMPAFTHRFYKRANEPYGFSPAMMALMDVRYANAMSKTELISAMMQSQPAYAVPSDAFLQPLNFNSLSINEYDSRNMSADQIFPLGAGGNVQINEMMLQKKYEAINREMFVDVFLAFQGITKEMTVPEVMIRANERMTILGPAVGGFMSVLEDVIAIALEKAWLAGRLPDMPPELQENPNYEVEFTSVLALAQKSSDMQSLQTALAMAGQLTQFDPNAALKVDAMRGVDSFWEITGADPSVKRDNAEVQALIEAQQQAAQAAEQLQTDAVQASTAVDVTKAQKNVSESQIPQ